MHVTVLRIKYTTKIISFWVEGCRGKFQNLINPGGKYRKQVSLIQDKLQGQIQVHIHTPLNI